jgi:hypothetical protein
MKIARVHFVTTGNDGDAPESERLHTVTAEDLAAWRRGEKNTEGAQAIEAGFSWLRSKYPFLSQIIFAVAKAS